MAIAISAATIMLIIPLHHGGRSVKTRIWEWGKKIITTTTKTKQSNKNSDNNNHKISYDYDKSNNQNNRPLKVE